jgi:hypothetical protein
MLGMITIIFTIFFAHADVLITHIMDVLGVFYSAMVFGSVSLTVFTILFKYIKLNRRNESPYSSSMVAILTGIPKNEATAIALSAVALAPLGPQVAFYGIHATLSSTSFSSSIHNSVLKAQVENNRLLWC